MRTKVSHELYFILHQPTFSLSQDYFGSLMISHHFLPELQKSRISELHKKGTQIKLVRAMLIMFRDSVLLTKLFELNYNNFYRPSADLGS